jgi:hypothetical protein
MRQFDSVALAVLNILLLIVINSERFTKTKDGGLDE